MASAASETMEFEQKVRFFCQFSENLAELSKETGFVFNAEVGKDSRVNPSSVFEAHLQLYHEAGSSFGGFSILSPLEFAEMTSPNFKFGFGSIVFNMEFHDKAATPRVLPPVVACGQGCPCKVRDVSEGRTPYHSVDEFCPVEWISQAFTMIPMKSLNFYVAELDVLLKVRITGDSFIPRDCPHLKKKWQNQLPAVMRRAFESSDQFHSDVVLRTEDKQFKVHSVILCVHSDVFRAMLTSELKEGREMEVIIEDMSPPSLEAFLRFLYFRDTEEMTKDIQIAVDLLGAANKYNVSDLHEVAHEIILDSPAHELSTATALDMFAYGELLGLPDITRVAARALGMRGKCLQKCDEFKKFAVDNPGAIPKLISLMLSSDH